MADPALECERPPITGSSVTAPPQRADEIFLEGPRSRFDELFTLFRVLLDFLRGFRVLHFVGPCVTVFGSARIKEGNPGYDLARKMGAGIEQLGIYRHDWRRSRHHGSRQPRREGCQRAISWLQY
jgi:hypothetical protein